MQDYFFRIADELAALLRGGELFTASFEAEQSDFVRLNHSAVRQAGTVAQRRLHFDLIEGKRHVGCSAALAGDLEHDRGVLLRQLAQAREALAASEPDPYLLYATAVHSSTREQPNQLPDARAALADVQRLGRGLDLVGLYAAGGQYSGFANSFGQRNWHASYSYNLSWSLYHQADKAVKASYAGSEWDARELERRGAAAGAQLAALSRPPREITPGRYRVYLAPEALRDLVGMLARGVGLRAQRTRTTPLLRMLEGGARLSPALDITEHTAAGVGPDFQERGFIKPPSVPLIRGGACADPLVSPQSALEYGVPTNGASGAELPVALDVAPGALRADAALRELGRGIYVSNLHYLNYSDRSACRTTGLTRFATFWVEDSAIAAPLSVMRFDETLYRALGENLVALTAERETLLSTYSYGRRTSHSARLPGALVEDFTFTL